MNINLKERMSRYESTHSKTFEDLTTSSVIEEQENIGVADMLNNLIIDEFEAISAYNSAISTLIDLDPNSPIIKVLEDILGEENLHVGQLQEALKLVSPASEEINKGAEEAEEQLG